MESNRYSYKIDNKLIGIKQMILSKICSKYVMQFDVSPDNIGGIITRNTSL